MVSMYDTKLKKIKVLAQLVFYLVLIQNAEFVCFEIETPCLWVCYKHKETQTTRIILCGNASLLSYIIGH